MKTNKDSSSRPLTAWITYIPADQQYYGSFFGLEKQYWLSKDIEELRKQLNEAAPEIATYRNEHRAEFVETMTFPDVA